MEYYFKLIVSVNDYYDSQIKPNLNQKLSAILKLNEKLWLVLVSSLNTYLGKTNFGILFGLQDFTIQIVLLHVKYLTI